jgi:hypothetical protein
MRIGCFLSLSFLAAGGGNSGNYTEATYGKSIDAITVIDSKPFVYSRTKPVWKNFKIVMEWRGRCEKPAVIVAYLIQY